MRSYTLFSMRESWTEWIFIVGHLPCRILQLLIPISTFFGDGMDCLDFLHADGKRKKGSKCFLLCLCELCYSVRTVAVIYSVVLNTKAQETCICDSAASQRAQQSFLHPFYHEQWEQECTSCFVSWRETTIQFRKAATMELCHEQGKRKSRWASR